MAKFKNIFSSWIQPVGQLSQSEKAAVLDNLKDASSPDRDFFVLTILSCTIATFGLILDSPAVIIGAMLVAPLMSPILGLSIASVSGLGRLLRESFKSVAAGVLAATAISAAIAFFTYRLPYSDLAGFSNEVLSRTKPSLFDLGVALAGGAAAAYALTHPKLSAAIPGVAIATALMPPVCVIGIGIAFLDASVILGALLLFLTNFAAIAFSGIIIFALMGFSPAKDELEGRSKRSVAFSASLVVVIGILLGIFTWQSLVEANLYNDTSNAIQESASRFTNARLLDLSISSEGNAKEISVTLRTTRELSTDEVMEIQDDLAVTLGSPVVLELIVVPMQVINPSKILFEQD